MIEPREFLIQFFKAKSITGKVPSNDVDLFESHHLDSLIVMELIAVMENTYGFRLTETEFHSGHFKNLNLLEELMLKKLRK